MDQKRPKNTSLIGSAVAHANLLNQSLLLISKYNHRAWKNPCGLATTANGNVVRFGIPGQADITGILKNGRRLEVEIKTGNATQSLQQKRFQKMIEANGGLYILVCNDCAQLVQALEKAMASPT